MAEITSENDLIRIFRLPELFPAGFYCFGEGQDVAFRLVDGFRLDSSLLIKTKGKQKDIIREFIKGKIYYDPNYKFLAITDYGEAFLI